MNFDNSLSARVLGGIARSIVTLALVFGAGSAEAGTWKAVFISGDNSIPNFDRGREDFAAALAKHGQVESFHLTSNSDLVDLKTRPPATINNIALALKKLKITDGDKCLIYMTSHGREGVGFYLSKSRFLVPDQLATYVDEYCGQRPTVILVSACYSGQFITEKLKGPNRIIMTAARSDRPSFGCSADTVYTYWDGCVIDAVTRSTTWYEVHVKAKSCIVAKERAKYISPGSEPQGFFGEDTRGTKILE